MRYLLDTHTFAWAVGDAGLLSEAAVQVLQHRQNQLFVSPASVWEMSIKHKLGKWPEVAPFMDEQLYAHLTRQLGASELLIDHRHTRLAGQLGAVHKDPFDRLLVAQALLENMTLVSKDSALDVFAVERLW